jgi:hypothetical protein
MRRHAPFLIACLLATSDLALAREPPQQELARAIQLFESFQDTEAAKALTDLLHRPAPASIAARAHLYLALIRLNAIDPEGARGEMEKALATDVMVDLPRGQSPKAQMLFAQARREIIAGGAETPPVGPAVTSPAPAPAASAETNGPRVGSSHLPAYLVGVGSLVAFGTGGLFGYLQQQALAAAENAAQAKTVAGLQGYANGQYPQDGLVADVLFGVGGAAAITAIVLFFTEGSGHGDVAVSVSAGPQGLSLRGAF